jgi:transcriptional regulator with XRE-family HTH domain
MTQQVLADRAGLSQSFISAVENGVKTVERRSTLVALAKALRVSVPELLGLPGDPTDPQTAYAVAHVPAVEVALIEIEHGIRRAPTRGPDELAAALDHVIDLRRQSGDYATMAPLLPALLHDAVAHGGVTQARVGFEASMCLKHLGHLALSRSAAQVSLAGALAAGDPVWIGAAQFVHTYVMPPDAAHVAAWIADRALTELQHGAADPNVRQMLGQLHLSAALACATDKRPDDAAAHLEAADQEARTLGDPEDGLGFNLLAFGPTNVGLWRMSVAAELGEPGKVVELAGKVDPVTLRVASRHYWYWFDRGRALAHSGKTDEEARDAFFRAEQAQPVVFSNNPMAHDTVLAMVNRAKRGAVPKDLQVLAHRVGIDVARAR